MPDIARIQIRINNESEEFGDVGQQSEYLPVTFGGYAQKVTTVGSIIYMAFAKPGTLESEAEWRVCKIDTTSGVRITWADGDNKTDNVATDLTALDYI
jgi:hypothetical protein